MSRNNKRKAFTFVEVLIAVAIVAVLFIVILANVDFAPNKANEAGLQQIFRSYQNACQSVGLQYSGFNDTKDELLRHLNQKLDKELQLSLVGDEIVTEATDPWGKIIKIEYSEPVGSKGQLKFISAGPDGVYYNADDIMTQIRYQNGGDIIIENPTNDPYHTHSYTLEVADPQFIYKAATCQSKAIYYKSCECGDKGPDTFEHGEFDFTNHENTTTSYVYLNDEKHNLVKKCTICSRQASATEQPHQDNGTGLCVYCGGTTHEHAFVIQSQAATAKKNDANCQSPLTYYLSCDCGLHSNSLTFTVGAINPSKHTGNKVNAGLQNAHTKYECCGAVADTVHDYTKSVVTEATCTQPGVDRFSCNCGYSYTDSSAVKGHDSNGQVATGTYLKSAATCSSPAIYYKSCSRCGAKSTQTFGSGSKDMNNHVGTTSQSYADYNENYHKVVVKCSGCKTNVSTTEEAHTLSGSNCTKCGRHIHVYDKEVVESKFSKTPATCVSSGVYYKSCGCGQSSAGTPNQATFEVAKNASNHRDAGCELVPANRDNACMVYSKCGTVADATHSMYFVGTAAVHSECADCGYTSATHTYDKETVNNKFLKEAANCTTGATYYRSCACGFFLPSNATFTNGTKDTSKHASGCNIVPAGTASVCMKYSLCGATADTTHAMSNTGTASVHQTCIDCNYKTTTHSYTAATCTTASACSCGYSNGPALGHSPATSATWDTNHTKATVKCTRSGCTASWYGEATKSITTTGTCTTNEQYKHTATFNVNGTSKTFTCSGHTGNKNAANHSGTVVNGGTQAVHTKYSCCGVTVSSTHSMSAATCTAGAKCSCGYTTGSGLGHDPQSSVSWDTNHTKGMVSCGRSGCTQTWSANTSEVTTTEATCMQVRIYKHKVTINVNGTNKTFECSGGHTGNKNASNHSGAGCTVVNAATASVCKKWSKCGATHTAAHTMAAATCTTKATCSVCGYQTGNVLGHSPATTCTWDTNHTKATVKCTRSGCTTTWSSTSVSEVTTTTATCMQVRVYKHTTTFSVNGTNKTFECSGGHNGSKDVANHSGAGCTVVNAATSSVCQKWSKCGASYDTTHNMAAATCTAQSTCTTCGYKTGSALGHSPATTCTWDTNHTKATVKCTRSGCSQTWSSTSVSEVTTTTATCMQVRVYKHTTTFSVNGTNKTFECSGGHTGSKDAANHSGAGCTVVNAATASVCKKWSKCGATHTAAHTMAGATCTTKATCSVCGYQTGNVLGHSPATTCTWDTNHTKATVKCTRTGCTQTWSSTSVSEVTTTTATCMQVRVYKHTTTFSVNGTNKTFECSGGHNGSKDAANHSGAGCTVVNAATASVCQKWSKCGASYDTTHNMAAATCTAQSTCTTCGYKTGSALGHSPATTCTWDTNHTKATVKCTRSGCSTTWSSTSVSEVTTTTATCTVKRVYKHTTTFSVNGTNKTFECSGGHVGTVNASNHTGSVVFGGTASVHTKYNCCNATASSTHSYANATCTAAATCGCGYTTGSALGHSPATTCTWDTNHTKATVACTRSGCSQTWSSTSVSEVTTTTATCMQVRVYKHTTTFSVNGTSKTFECSGGHTGSKNASNHSGAGCTVVNAATASVCQKWSKCGATYVAAHTPNADDGNCTTAIKCKTCGYITTAAKSHVFTNDADTSCNNSGCTYTRSVTANYKVNHYQMNTSGIYPSTPFATETLSGTNNTTLTLANLKKAYTGFTYSYGQVGGSTVTTTTILADGTRVINLYYTRNKYTVTLSKGTGVASVSGAGTYYYGASVTINATMSAGYNWYKWTGTHSTTTQNYTFTMPASNVSDTANSTAGTFYVTYDANGGTGAPATQSFTFNANQTISTTKPTRACYTFSHWLSNPNSVTFAPGATIPGGWGSFTLIAQWTFVGHTYSNSCDTSCNGCGATRTITHTYSYTCDTTCNVCGATRSASHNMVNGGTASVHTKCSYGCGYQTTTHSYTKTTQTAATCTVKGTSKYTCSCGYNYTSQDIAALGHNYQTQTAATCTAAEVEKCSRCTSTRTGDPALGHTTPADDGNCTTAIKCGRGCGTTMVAAMSHSYTNACDTTCNNSGCTAGNRIITHTPRDDDANCTTAITCSVCGATTTAAKSHTYDNACDKTCNNSGCAYTRTTSHNFDSAVPVYDWQSGCSSCFRYKNCTVCGARSDIEWAETIYDYGSYHNGGFNGGNDWMTCGMDHTYGSSDYGWTDESYDAYYQTCPGCGGQMTPSGTGRWSGSSGGESMCSYWQEYNCSSCGEYDTFDIAWFSGHDYKFDCHYTLGSNSGVCPYWHGDYNEGTYNWGEKNCNTTHTYTMACDNSCNNPNCTQTRSISHSYSVSCDPTCDLCGYTRYVYTGSHSYSYTCDTTCNGCGYTRTASHSSSADDGNCTTAVMCRYGCGYVYTAAKSHTYTNDCDATCNNTGCTAGNRSASHNFVNGTCSKCGQTGCTTHTFGTVNYSWSSGCGSCTASATCTTCGQYVTETDYSPSAGNYCEYGYDYTAYFSTSGFGSSRCPDWHGGSYSVAECPDCGDTSWTCNGDNSSCDTISMTSTCNGCGYSVAWSSSYDYTTDNPENSDQYEHNVACGYCGGEHCCAYWHNY